MASISNMKIFAPHQSLKYSSTDLIKVILVEYHQKKLKNVENVNPYSSMNSWISLWLLSTISDLVNTLKMISCFWIFHHSSI